MAKYGKPVWQYVFEAAKEIDGAFTAVDIIRKVQQENSDIPEVTIRSYVMAMAPNHLFSGHWPSIRRLHGLFKYLGDNRFTLLEKDNEGISDADEVESKEFTEQEQATFLAELKKFTVKELKEYDGKNGKSIYVAFHGKVYNVSQSGLWDGGDHLGGHQAGKDLTEEMELAPHREEVFERKHVKVIGRLEKV